MENSGFQSDDQSNIRRISRTISANVQNDGSAMPMKPRYTVLM